MVAPQPEPHLEDIIDIPQGYLCPISLDIMSSPVMLLQTGRIYDNAQFGQWLAQGGTTDPLTRIALKSPVTLRPCLELREEIQEFASRHGIVLDSPQFKAITFVASSKQGQKEVGLSQQGRRPNKLKDLAKKVTAFLLSPATVRIAAQ